MNRQLIKKYLNFYSDRLEEPPGLEELLQTPDGIDRLLEVAAEMAQEDHESFRATSLLFRDLSTGVLLTDAQETVRERVPSSRWFQIVGENLSRV